MAWSEEHRAFIVEEFIKNTGSPIWEANKFKTKEHTANIFFISGKYTECRFNPLAYTAAYEAV
jgi:hypothetical protein